MKELERMLNELVYGKPRKRYPRRMYRAFTGLGSSGYQFFRTEEEMLTAAQSAANRLGRSVEIMRRTSGNSYYSLGMISPSDSNNQGGS